MATPVTAAMAVLRFGPDPDLPHLFAAAAGGGWLANAGRCAVCLGRDDDPIHKEASA